MPNMTGRKLDSKKAVKQVKPITQATLVKNQVGQDILTYMTYLIIAR